MPHEEVLQEVQIEEGDRGVDLRIVDDRPRGGGAAQDPIRLPEVGESDGPVEAGVDREAGLQEVAIIGMYVTETTSDPLTATVIASVVLLHLIMEIMGLHIVMMVAEVTSVEVLPLVGEVETLVLLPLTEAVATPMDTGTQALLLAVGARADVADEMKALLGYPYWCATSPRI